jgi:hypothetical protein
VLQHLQADGVAASPEAGQCWHSLADNGPFLYHLDFSLLVRFAGIIVVDMIAMHRATIIFVLTAFVFSCRSQRGKIAMPPTVLKLGTLLVHCQSAQDDHDDEHSGAHPCQARRFIL